MRRNRNRTQLAQLMKAYSVSSFCKSPIRGVREPESPRLNDRSLKIVQKFEKDESSL